MTRHLRAGEVAAAADVNRETLRYYERGGLIAQPPRSLGGHRLYPSATVQRLRTIKAAQRLGFTLAEIKALLGDRGDGVQAKARSKLEQVQARIAELQDTAATLEAALDLGCDDLDTCAATPACPLSH